MKVSIRNLRINGKPVEVDPKMSVIYRQDGRHQRIGGPSSEGVAIPEGAQAARMTVDLSGLGTALRQQLRKPKGQ